MIRKRKQAFFKYGASWLSGLLFLLSRTDILFASEKADPASLDRLHDIVTPPPVSIWPPANGWYIAMSMTLVMIAIVVLYSVVQYRAGAYKRAALGELESLTYRLDAGENPAALLNEAAGILKRTAIKAFSRTEVAGLSGERWVEWLNKKGKGTPFDGRKALLLSDLIYGRSADSLVTPDDFRDVVRAMRFWIGGR